MYVDRVTDRSTRLPFGVCHQSCLEGRLLVTVLAFVTTKKSAGDAPLPLSQQVQAQSRGGKDGLSLLDFFGTLCLELG